ncbi:uncharacterized protein LOC134530157 [Bacillus rossius redtenbacheri]|uniref:uncharacterized protein LOC134530157 n=1 Tax=Bacillus rossius redtenbacheri TaxID=93214 RepID=UPI002FDEC29B
MEILQEVTKKRKAINEATNLPNSKKQALLTFSQKGSGASQATVDRLILNFVCSTLQPFSVVEDESFVNLVQCLAPGRSVMCRQTMAVRLKECYETLKKKLMAELALVSNVAITADCWSHFSRAYLGITVHWIDEETIQRKSAMLTIERLVGRHTYDILAAAIHKALREFHIHNKVLACVTDNGSNFVKAFSMFGLHSQTDVKEDKDNDDELEIVDVSSILDEGQNEFHYVLPPHQRCAAHTLNLVAVKDSQNAESDPAFKKVARSTFARCQALWNKQRSTVAADLVKEIFGKLLYTPCATRWNSLYDSVNCLLSVVQQHGEDMLDKLVDGLGLPRFRPAELAFLVEYAMVMKPLALALNILQAEKNMFAGYLQPTITSILRELGKKMNDSSVVYCRPLAKALHEGVDKRFGSILEDNKLTTAAGLIPSLKFSWLEGQQKEEAVSSFKNEIDAFASGASSASVMTEENVNRDEEAIFLNILTTSVSPVLEEVNSYLMNSHSDLQCLQHYPILKSAFLKFNTSLPSSAPVERLFSVGKDVFAIKRGNLSDENFKMQLFCKVNYKI